MCEKKLNGRIEVTFDSEYDPLFKDENTASGIPRYNHIEGFEFSGIEDQENLHRAMIHERQYPTLDNQAFCYSLIKDMISKYWAEEKIAHDDRVKKALAENE